MMRSIAMSNLILVPIAVFLLTLMVVSYFSQKNLNKKNGNFSKEYFIADRKLGGFVLAMTLVATYGSVSSFVSGPGVAWNLGFGWVAFAAPQIITGFLLLGIIGNKLALVARKTDAITIIDIIHARYQNSSLTLILSVVMLVFFTAMVVGQFVGGAQIFAAITGLDYSLGLFIFATVTVIYTSSGFKAVAITDTICAILMLVGMFTLGYVIIRDGGGFTHIMETLSQKDVGTDGISRHFKVNADGLLPFSLLFSAWFLVGFFTLALPQSCVRALAYKRTSDLHLAMIVATVVCGALMIGMTLLGVLSAGVIADKPQNGTDAIIPLLIATHMSPIIAGITIIGPLAATMSTVSSLLIAASSSVVSDIAKQLSHSKMDEDTPASHEPPALSQKKLPTILITLLIGGISILLALYPQDIVVWINLFAFGGLESAFIWPIVLGLFWKRMNAGGALLGVIFSLGIYILCMAYGIKILSFHNVIIGALSGLVFSILGTYCFKAPNSQIQEIFFPHKCKEQQ